MVDFYFDKFFTDTQVVILDSQLAELLTSDIKFYPRPPIIPSIFFKEFSACVCQIDLIFDLKNNQGGLYHVSSFRFDRCPLPVCRDIDWILLLYNFHHLFPYSISEFVGMGKNVMEEKLSAIFLKNTVYFVDWKK